MDTGKLLKIIQDIQEDESNLGIQSKLQAFLDSYRNDRNAANLAEIDELKNLLPESKVANYASIEYRSLEELNINHFFGTNISTELDKILESRDPEILKMLEVYIQDRQNILNRLGTMVNPMTELGLTARVLEEDQFEVAFLFPKYFSDLENFHEALKDIQIFLARLSDALGDKEPLLITSVSNGHLEVYINAGINLAQHFSSVLDFILKAKGAFGLWNDLKKFREYLSSAKNKNALTELVEEEKNLNTDSLIDNLVENLKIERSAQNELKKTLRNLISHLENGLEAEVRTPEIPKPAEPGDEASEEERKNYREKKRLYNLKTKIDKTNRAFSKLTGEDLGLINTKLKGAAIRAGKRKSQKSESPQE